MIKIHKDVEKYIKLKFVILVPPNLRPPSNPSIIQGTSLMVSSEYTLKKLGDNMQSSALNHSVSPPLFLTSDSFRLIRC